MGGTGGQKKSKLHISVLGKDKGTNQANEAPRRDSSGVQDHHRALLRARGRAKLTSAGEQSGATKKDPELSAFSSLPSDSC